MIDYRVGYTFTRAHLQYIHRIRIQIRLIEYRLRLHVRISLIPSRLTASQLTSFRPSWDWVRVHCVVTTNWVASQRTTQFAVAATNHVAPTSDEMRSAEMSDKNSRTLLYFVIIERSSVRYGQFTPPDTTWRSSCVVSGGVNLLLVNATGTV